MEPNAPRISTDRGFLERVLSHKAFIPFLLLLLFVSTLPVLWAPPARDQANWLVAAEALGAGRVLYKDYLLLNTPGPAFIYYVCLLLSGGNAYGALWICHVVFTLLTAVAGYLLLKTCRGRVEASGALALFTIWWPFTVQWWEFAQKDVLTVVFHLFSFYYMAKYLYGDQRKRDVLLSGLHVGLAFLCKAPYLLTAGSLGLCYLLVSLPHQRPIHRARTSFIKDALVDGMICGVGCLLPLVPVVLYLLYFDAFGEMYSSFTERTSAYAGALRTPFWEFLWGKPALRIHEFFGVLAIFWIVPLLSSSSRKNLSVLVVAVATSWILYVAQARGWKYHAVPWGVEGIFLTGALMTHMLVSQKPRLRTLGVVGVLLCLVCFSYFTLGKHYRGLARLWRGPLGLKSQLDYFHSFKRPGMISPASLYVAGKYIRERTLSTDTIFVWGMESQIYVDSKRLTAGQTCCDAPIFNPLLEDAAASWFKKQVSDFLMLLRKRSPAFFVVIKDDENGVEPVASDEALLRLPPLVEFLRENYSVCTVIDKQIEIYGLKTKGCSVP